MRVTKDRKKTAKPRSKIASRASAGAYAVKATTIRLDPIVMKGLALLRQVDRQPLNKLVNIALKNYLERRSAEVEADLQQIIERVRAYRRADPKFKQAWDAFADAEARHGHEDPVEGRIVRAEAAGPAQTAVRALLGSA